MKHRWLTVVLALLAAAAFALATHGGRWWSIGDTASIGPFGSQSTFGGAGRLSWAGGDERWVRFGIATGAGGLIAMFALLLVAGAVAANRVPRLAARMTLVAIATAGLAATGFVAMRPDSGLPFTLDRGVALFGAAIILGAVAAIRVLRAPASAPSRSP
jgi:hypothetical protein